LLVLVLVLVLSWLPTYTSACGRRTTTSIILCRTMLATRLAKQLASLHSTHITRLKLMSSSLCIHN
jgi:hypothetical protein